MPKTRIAVALSGGVDSSVTAALLQEQGFEVEGIFMKNWSPDTIQALTDCPWEQDQADAAAVCAHLGIPFRSLNFEKEYYQQVVQYFLAEYAAGRTPNPDVMCNREIKFKAFLEAAEALGFEKMATGHYARILDGQLARGFDRAKDQSYFLYALNAEQLSKSLFPLGELTKPEVRLLAQKFQLPTAQKKDSQGICFIGHLDLKKFLAEQLVSLPGETYLLPKYKEGTTLSERIKQAKVVGKHPGSLFFTIGERLGQGVDNLSYRRLLGQTDVPPLYLLAKNSQDNTLYLSDNPQDPDLSCHFLTIEGWLSPISALPRQGDQAQVRYQQRELATIKSVTRQGEVLKLELDPETPLWSVAPGQSLVVYAGDRVVGGGIVQATSSTIL